MLTIAIVEDQAVIREGLAFLIDNTPGFKCVGRYRTMEIALHEIPTALPEVALIDIGLPGMSGIEGIRILKERHPDILLLTLTVYDDDERIFDAICAGASGYILKKTPPAKLLEYIDEARSGGAPMSPEIARKVMELFRKTPPPKKADHNLTAHEARLVRMLVDGHTCKSAAADLGVTVHAITWHLRNVYEKLHVHSKTEAVSKALREGLV
ncbi:MAG: DNA-binding response regulator [Acidobacteria bacterium]|nr:MAG: DNA-binding response regulator [Acidobacteriota bacterium]